jgi:hypothetical protein
MSAENTTTAPVVTVTDELIEQLNALTCLNESGAVMIHVDQVRALLAERAELKRDAEEYRKLRDGACWPAVFASSVAAEPLRGHALDAAMASSHP